MYVRSDRPKNFSPHVPTVHCIVVNCAHHTIETAGQSRCRIDRIHISTGSIVYAFVADDVLFEPVVERMHLNWVLPQVPWAPP